MFEFLFVTMLVLPFSIVLWSVAITMGRDLYKEFFK